MGLRSHTGGGSTVLEAPVSRPAPLVRPLAESPALRAGAMDGGLIRAHAIAAMAALALALSFGALMAVQLVFPDVGAGVPWLSWGRVRYAHTQSLMFGWLGNAFFAFLYYAVPLITGRPVSSGRLGLWLFAAWNFAIVLPGLVLVLGGVSQPLEWAEFPLVIDLLITGALVLAVIQFVPACVREGLEHLYVSGWYIAGGLAFTLLAYPMGNIVPNLVPGAAGAAFSGLWIHDAVGLFVTPLALAIVYLVVPVATGRPIYSHVLSMVGFWGLLLVYPFNGTHHYVFSVIPMEAQTAAIAASTVLGVDVIIVVANLLLSLRGSGFLPRDLGLRFAAVAVYCYLAVSLQGALQAQMAVNERVHFTDWVIGHSHLAMFGFASFAAIAGVVHIWERMPGRRFHPRLVSSAFWLLLGGMLTMVVALTAAGLVQGRSWQSSEPWLAGLEASRVFWMARAATAVPIIAGFVCLCAGLLTGPRVQAYRVAVPSVDTPTPQRGVGVLDPATTPGSV
jgi:cbb3-type cytochrome oxidase subunit 1